MTGYGLASVENEKRAVTVEIKTLNSKFLDAIFKLPKQFADKELEIRGSLSEKLERGKITLSIEYLNKNNQLAPLSINKDLFKIYYEQLNVLAEEAGASPTDNFKTALNFPDVINNNVMPDPDESIDEWVEINKVIKEAVQYTDKFRIKEGENLKEKIIQNIHNIKKLSEEIAVLDPLRADAVKARLRQHLNELEQIDENRFEQEIIYYLEKLDINEEKVRLSSHLDFFMEVITKDQSPGKKLGFISQEIGREINTIGSKANDAGIQRLVIGMKEELEQIKEQLLNIL
ncbi:YicC family protein [soil metagenome]